MAKKTKPDYKEAHDYMTMNFGNGRVFTIGRSGGKGTNISDEVFNKLVAFIKANSRGEGKNYGTAMKLLLGQIDTVWPQWNDQPLTFQSGETVLGPNGKRGIVKDKRRVNYAVHFEGTNYITLISPWLLTKVTK